MAVFDNALYYPWIDINDDRWLKTAALFWDNIYTIVPEGLSSPYRRSDTEYLSDIGFLRPLRVNSNNSSVIKASDEAIKWMCSPKFWRVMRHDKMTREYGKESILYKDKMSGRLMNCLYELLGTQYNEYTDSYSSYSTFTLSYMVTLTSKLCEEYSLCPITNDGACYNPMNLARRFPPSKGFRKEFHVSAEQGLMLDLIINGLSISPDADLEDIIKFKCQHRDELGQFKVRLAELTEEIPPDAPLSAVREHIKSIYHNKFLPDYNDLRAALASARISFLANTFLKVSAVSFSSTGILSQAGLPMKQSLLASAGVSLIAAATSYAANKSQILRKNPYSYLLSIKNEW